MVRKLSSARTGLAGDRDVLRDRELLELRDRDFDRDLERDFDREAERDFDLLLLLEDELDERDLLFDVADLDLPRRPRDDDHDLDLLLLLIGVILLRDLDLFPRDLDLEVCERLEVGFVRRPLRDLLRLRRETDDRLRHRGDRDLDLQ